MDIASRTLCAQWPFLSSLAALSQPQGVHCKTIRNETK